MRHGKGPASAPASGRPRTNIDDNEVMPRSWPGGRRTVGPAWLQVMLTLTLRNLARKPSLEKPGWSAPWRPARDRRSDLTARHCRRDRLGRVDRRQPLDRGGADPDRLQPMLDRVPLATGSKPGPGSPDRPTANSDKWAWHQGDHADQRRRAGDVGGAMSCAAAPADLAAARPPSGGSRVRSSRRRYWPRKVRRSGRACPSGRSIVTVVPSSAISETWPTRSPRRRSWRSDAGEAGAGRPQGRARTTTAAWTRALALTRRGTGAAGSRRHLRSPDPVARRSSGRVRPRATLGHGFGDLGGATSARQEWHSSVAQHERRSLR
jgi:hypothetical protein